MVLVFPTTGSQRNSCCAIALGTDRFGWSLYFGLGRPYRIASCRFRVAGLLFAEGR
jgi:hypothetical protein